MSLSGAATVRSGAERSGVGSAPTQSLPPSASELRELVDPRLHELLLKVLRV